MKRSLVYRMSLDAMFIALYFVLAKITLAFGNVHITFASLPILVSALLFGVGDTIVIAALGEFLIQVFSYGFSVTLPLWLVPPVLRALIIGVVAAIYRKKGEELDHHIVAYYLTVLGSTLVVTAANTGVLYLDAIIIGYPVSVVWLETLVRIGVGLLTAILVALSAHPLADALRHLSPSLSPAKPR
jgi:riboflavin transporter